SDSLISAQTCSATLPGCFDLWYIWCNCRVAKSSQGIRRSGFALCMALHMDLSGVKPLYGRISCAAPVLVRGWPNGQTAATAQPALLRAMARRAVVNQRHVATNSTFVFTLTRTSESIQATIQYRVAFNLRTIWLR